MTETVKPALTVGEWVARSMSGFVPRTDAEILHASAAIALYGQPFGFTREDVTLVLETIGTEWSLASPSEARELTAQMRHLAARIQALLPPDEVKG